MIRAKHDARPDPPPFQVSLHERTTTPQASVSRHTTRIWRDRLTNSRNRRLISDIGSARWRGTSIPRVGYRPRPSRSRRRRGRDAFGARRRCVSAIYEGAFSFDQVSVRADILIRPRDRRFDLVEVKSTLDLKPEHEWDVAVQLYVLEGARLPLRWVRLMHLNRDYVYPGGGYDLKQLFTFTNLTRRARKRRSDIVSALKAIRRALAGKSPPPISTGSHCYTPYACPFHEHCHQGEPDHSIDQLPRLRERLREQLVSMGILDIRKIPSDFEGLSSLQSRVAHAVRTGRRFHDPAVSKSWQRQIPDRFRRFRDLFTGAPALSRHQPLPDDSVSVVRSHPQCRRWSVASRVSARSRSDPRRHSPRACWRLWGAKARLSPTEASKPRD